MTRKLLACSIFAATASLGLAHAQTTINSGGSSLAAPTYISEYQTYTAANPSILFNYEAVGSGDGQKAFLNNDITQFEPPIVTPSTLTYGTIVGTQVDIGASDAFLSSSQLTDAATGSYGTPPEGSASDGPVIQLPTFGTPITIPFNQTTVPKAGLTLTDAQVCSVLSGQTTDWHTLDKTIKAGTTIGVVYRSDSSGTTFLLTQHLNAVCNSSNSNFPNYPVPVTKTFASIWTSATPTALPVPATFSGQSGSAAVASYMVATANTLGYLSPDYTSIAPKSASTTSLRVASLTNASNGKAYTPSVANTETGLASAGAGSTNATPPATLSAAMDPLNWVPAIPLTTAGYPIVGYTTMLTSTCFASATAGSAINAFLKDQYSNTTYTTIIQNNGFAPLKNTKASAYVTAIEDIFLGNTKKYNLNIDNATTCASYPGR